MSTDPGVNGEFLRTLLASNAIWASVTLTLTTVGGIVLALWRRRVLKAQARRDDEARKAVVEAAAAERAMYCTH